MTRVLIVEDERIIAWNIQEVLKLTDHDVISSVSTAEEAIALAGQLRPDLVLMDIRLRGKLDGIAAAEEIYTTYGIPSIYLTAYADDCTVERAMETAPFGYILKPFKRSDLLLAIKVAIQRHEREQTSTAQTRRYNAMLNSLGEGAIATDADGQITDMNDAAERMTGWSAQDAVGKSIQEILQPLYPEGESAIADSLKMTIQNHMSAQQDNHRAQSPVSELVLGSGEGHQVNASVPALLVDDQDNVIGCIMTLRNVISHHTALSSPDFSNPEPSTPESPGNIAFKGSETPIDEAEGALAYGHQAALLAKFTTAIRKSLDDKSIIQDIVNDLGRNLGLLGCHVTVHQAHSPNTSILVAAFCGDNPDLTHFSPIGDTRSAIIRQLLLRQPIHCCLATSVDSPLPFQHPDPWVAAVICPILNHHGALMGDLLVMRPVEAPFSAADMSFLQYMADHCAIAIRQSHLYQTVQSYQHDVGDRPILKGLPPGWITALSHELRTPLSNIKMASQMLELALKSLGLLEDMGHPAQEYFQILRYESQREARLVEALVEANQSSDTQVLTFNSTNLFVLIQEVVNPCLWQVTKKNQQLMIHNGDDPLIIKTVPAILKRVLGELLDYVCRYSSPGCDIHISARMIPPMLQESTDGWDEQNPQKSDRPHESAHALDSLELTIQYTASHMTAVEINALLHAYTQDMENSAFELGNTGLGLFLAQQQIKKLNGQLTVHDDDEMITFSLYLPDTRVNREKRIQE